MTRHLTDTLKLSIRKETKQREQENQSNELARLLNELYLSMEARVIDNIREYDIAELENFIESAKLLNKVSGKKYDTSFVEQHIQTL